MCSIPSQATCPCCRLQTVGPHFSPDPSLESPHQERGMMPESAWPRSSEMGSWVPRRPWLCQQIHKDGVGCGLAEDEGSQGD